MAAPLAGYPARLANPTLEESLQMLAFKKQTGMLTFWNTLCSEVFPHTGLEIGFAVLSASTTKEPTPPTYEKVLPTPLCPPTRRHAKKKLVSCTVALAL